MGTLRTLHPKMGTGDGTRAASRGRSLAALAAVRGVDDGVPRRLDRRHEQDPSPQSPRQRGGTAAGRARVRGSVRMRTPAGVMERRDYERNVSRIVRRYEVDPDAAYRAERRLLDRFVRDRGYEGDLRAMEIVRLLDWDRPVPRIGP